MASPNPQAGEAVRAVRREQRAMGDPLNTETRRVQTQGSGTAKYVNLTDYAVKTLGVNAGDDLLVEAHPDRIVIKPEGSDA